MHWCEYPRVDESLIDEQLSADMESLLRVVSLGSSARNAVKLKVRQPLAELKVQPGSDSDRRAVARFAEQIVEELNIKKVTLHEPSTGSLLRFEAKPNMKTLGAKFKAQPLTYKPPSSLLPATELAAKVQASNT